MPTSLRSYGLLVRWQALELRRELPFIVIIQAMLAAAVVFGASLVVPDLEGRSVVFLATGAPTLTIVTVGLVLVPQRLATKREAGTDEYIWTLPIPRLAYLLADLTVLGATAVPGLVIGLGLAAVRFDFGLDVHPLVVPAFLLVAVTATAIGYAIAYLSPSPWVTTLTTNVVVLGLFLFSPILYPAERLPDAAAALHRLLPAAHMGDAMRATLVGAAIPWGSMAALGAWCAGALSVTYAVVNRRP